MSDGDALCAFLAFITAVLAGVAVGLLIVGDFATDYDVGRVESDVAVLQHWIESLFDLVLERCRR